MCVLFFSLFFLFKPKTASEMRIMDGSSDVCSSDLAGSDADFTVDQQLSAMPLDDVLDDRQPQSRAADRTRPSGIDSIESLGQPGEMLGRNSLPLILYRQPHHRRAVRSEEHTSELQSLMRISYAVFCLKKKKKQK